MKAAVVDPHSVVEKKVQREEQKKNENSKKGTNEDLFVQQLSHKKTNEKYTKMRLSGLKGISVQPVRQILRQIGKCIFFLKQNG